MDSLILNGGVMKVDVALKLLSFGVDNIYIFQVKVFFSFFVVTNIILVFFNIVDFMSNLFFLVFIIIIHVFNTIIVD
jgi:hypothetical protein